MRGQVSERRVRLRVRQVGPRPPLPQLSSPDPTQGDSSPTSAPDTAREPTRFQRFVRWYRRADLAKHTAVLAAAVAAASLAITAWGTYKAAQVADDQLAQSREDHKNDERAQASRISIWVEGGQLVLANRSLDPAWAYAYLESPVVPPNPELRLGGLPLRTGILPPCTRLNVPVELDEPLQESLGSRLGITFVDTEGRVWTRRGGGELLQQPELQNILRESAEKDTKDAVWVTEKDVEVKTLSECGQAAHPTQ